MEKAGLRIYQQVCEGKPEHGWKTYKLSGQTKIVIQGNLSTALIAEVVDLYKSRFIDNEDGYGA